MTVLFRLSRVILQDGQPTGGGSQGLFYLDWLLDHRKDCQWLVLVKLGNAVADAVDWSAPRLICIAGNFNCYDDHAVKQISRNIELIRYRRFGPDLLLLDLVAATTGGAPFPGGKVIAPMENVTTVSKFRTISAVLEELEPVTVDRYEALRAYLLALGDDAQETTLRFYIAFKRIKNFACVEFRPSTAKILIYVKVDASTVALESGFTRDVSRVGHFGTGDLEITLTEPEDLERAELLIQQSYDAS
jgi:predicted transport protein